MKLGNGLWKDGILSGLGIEKFEGVGDELLDATTPKLTLGDVKKVGGDGLEKRGMMMEQKGEGRVGRAGRAVMGIVAVAMLAVGML